MQRFARPCPFVLQTDARSARTRMAVAEAQQSAPQQQLDVAAEEEECAVGPMRVEELEVSAFWQPVLSCPAAGRAPGADPGFMCRAPASTGTTWQS